MPADRFIGLMSGTSMDGLDATVVDFRQAAPQLVAAHTEPLPAKLAERLRRLARNQRVGINVLAETSREFALHSARAVHNLLAVAGLNTSDINAIGSHGQTIRHRAHGKRPFTLQIGDPATIAIHTAITTVADFRSMDIAAGGQGAPLAPLFHAVLAPVDRACAVINIGGIANVSILSPGEPMTACDSGPGNCLVDAWMRRQYGRPRDDDGALAARGKVDPGLLEALMAHPYFTYPAPKSTGVETFNLGWIDSVLATRDNTARDEDIAATLTALTAHTIRDALATTGPNTPLYICGGGAHNRTLMVHIRNLMPHRTVTDTTPLGIGPDWVEAAAFAWLARERLAGRHLDTPPITGAKRPLLLGAIYEPH